MNVIQQIAVTSVAAWGLALECANGGGAGAVEATRTSLIQERMIATDQVARIRSHLMILNQAQKDAGLLLPRALEGAARVPEIDARVKLLLHKSSPMSRAELTMLFSGSIPATDRASVMRAHQSIARGEGTLGSWISMLSEDPCWMPALVGILEAQRSWYRAVRYGSIAMDLLDAGDLLADEILILMPAGSAARREGTTQEMASMTLHALRENVRMDAPTVKGMDAGELEALDRALAYHSGDFARARLQYETAVAAGVARPSTYFRLAKMVAVSDGMDAAKRVVARGLERCEKGKAVLLALAAEYARTSNEYDVAMKLAQECLVSSPEHPMAHYVIAEVESARGNREAALRSCADGLRYSYGWGSGVVKRGRLVATSLGVVSNEGSVE